MARDLLADLRRWLAAEGHDDPSAADSAFHAVFQVVPQYGPSAAFADRVLAAARATRRRPDWSVLNSPWLRPVTGIGLTLAGLAALGVTATYPVPAFTFLVGAWGGAVTHAAVWLSRTLDIGFEVWAVFGRVGAVTQVVIATPWVSVALAGNGILALVAFCGLRRLLGPREEMLSW